MGSSVGVVKKLLSNSPFVTKVPFVALKSTRSSESDGRYDVADGFDLQFVLIALIGLDFSDCPDWFRFPRLP